MGIQTFAQRLGISGRNAFWMAVILALVVAFDQLTKYLVLQNIARGEIVPVIPDFFNLTLTFNRGAAFGLLSDLPDGTRQLVLAVTTLIALSAVLYFLVRDFHGERVAHYSMALILGGAFGNVIDRVRLGEVVDFLDVYWGTYHWPAFNIADSAICVGVAILLLKKPRTHSAKDAPLDAPS
jgi:signal peptidase II